MPSNKKKKSMRSGAEVATDDFDDMLAEFAAADLESSANSKSTSTITITTASTVLTASKTTEDDIIEVCAAGNLNQVRRWGRQEIRVVSARPLLQALRQNKLEATRCIVNDLGADVNQMSDSGKCTTPLTMAAYWGHLELVRCPVKDLGADVNQRSPDGSTVLFLAASKENPNLVRLLVKAGFSLWFRNSGTIAEP
jgi:hypothetical protein